MAAPATTPAEAPAPAASPVPGPGESAIMAARYDAAGACFGGNEVIGVGDAERGCDDVETLALDAAGTCWLFGDNCLTAGFTDVTQTPSDRCRFSDAGCD